MSGSLCVCVCSVYLLDYLTSNNNEALKVALENPPYLSKDKVLKVRADLVRLTPLAQAHPLSRPSLPPLPLQDRNMAIVLDVLMRFRSADVEKAVNSLSPDQVDVLMKYIYRGFAFPTEKSCGILLVWHEKVASPPSHPPLPSSHHTLPPSLLQAVASGGVGSIIRVMTNRKGL